MHKNQNFRLRTTGGEERMHFAPCTVSNTFSSLESGGSIEGFKERAGEEGHIEEHGKFKINRSIV